MKKFLFILAMAILSACQTGTDKKASTDPDPSFAHFLDAYYEARLKIFPLDATYNGEQGYDDLLYADFTDSRRETQKQFFQSVLDSLKHYKYDDLNDDDKLSYDVLHHDITMALEGLTYNDYLLPANQFYSMPITIGQLGSGTSAQPFTTEADYQNWLKRIDAFSMWVDSAIVYFRKGMEQQVVLPRSLVVKMIPQMKAMKVAKPEKSIFYGPITNMPAGFSDSVKRNITIAYEAAIMQKIIPAYLKLGEFLETEYLAKARSTSGSNGNPGGDKLYEYLARLNTTTTKTPDEIYNTGLEEVKRISGEMEKIKNEVEFKGNLKAFFEFMNTDKQFFPFKTPADVLGRFHQIHATMKPFLQKMFTDTPKTKFEIRQTEAFRAESASAEYSQGTPDGSRPGIFYVPILDASKYNVTSGMESLFLHEAIPGHHYQISLQQENTSLPKFRRFDGNNAYVEGWALYCESLGKELGLYTDPYQYMGALGDEMHRAVRLVVDVAIHTKNMSREEAIKYMMEKQPISEQSATAEIERYMAIPGQALSYKMGAIKIGELRKKFEQELGAAFNLAEFHNEVLKDGPLPLEVLEKKLGRWAAAKQKN